MKSYRLSLILLSLLIIGSFSASFIPTVIGAEDLNFTFKDNVLYNGEIVNNTLNYNLEKRQNNTGFYNGTYTFTNEANDITPTGWIEDSTGTCNATVYPEFYNHSKVLRLSDYDATYRASAYTTFPNQENGTIEFWIAKEDSDAHGNPMFTMSDGTFAMNVLATSGTFALYYGGSVHFTSVTWVTHQWYHIRLGFDCSDNELNITIDGNLEIEGEFENTVPYINKAYLQTAGDKDNYAYMYDGIGFSWFDNYSVFDNYFPIMEYTSIDQVKSYEFGLNSEGYLNEIGLDNVNGWYDIEDSALNPDSVNCYISDDYIDRSIRIYKAQEGNAGITQDFNDDDGIMFNISIELDIEAYGYPDSEIYIDIYSYDVTKIYSFRLNGTSYIYGSYNKPADLSYFDGVDWVAIMSDIPVKQNLNQKFNFVWLNGFSGFLKYEYNEVSEQFLIPTLDNSKVGLGNVSIYGINDNAVVYGNLDISIDSIAVNVDGISITTEPVNVSFEYLPIESWDTNRYNLIELTFNTDYINNISLWVDELQIVEYEATIEIQSYIRNVYDKGILYNPIINIYSNDTYEITNVKVHGSALALNDDYFYPTYYFDNVNINNSYFWVDSNNKFQYSLIVNDNDLEYIQASFNIQDVASENRSASFTSNIDGDSKGFLLMVYSDSTSTYIEFPYSQSTSALILPQTKTIEQLSILITDNDLYDNDLCDGYIANIRLIYYPNISVTIVTLDLLAIIVPLMILIMPSVAIHKKFGSVGALIMFILMALVCVASDLIPMWLFFVIAISSIGFLFMKDKIEVMNG